VKEKDRKKDACGKKAHASFGFSFGLNNVVGTAAKQSCAVYDQKNSGSDASG
jgi:hypothetical protein